MTDFQPGQRVMVAYWKFSSSPSMDMTGYYGHVVETYIGGSLRPMVDVALIGRVGAPAREQDLDRTAHPWIFYADELEHAD